MKEIRLGGKIRYVINELQYIAITRDNGYRAEFREGKSRESFLYTLTGNLRYVFADGRPAIEAESGTLCHIPARTPYRSEYQKDGTRAHIFMFSFSEDIPPFLKEPFCLKNRQINELIAGITEDQNQLCATLYGLLAITGTGTEQLSEEEKRIFSAKKELETHYFENRKVADYAHLCNMSESNFRRLFFRVTGKSPLEYRNGIRMTEAVKLIDSEECTVEEAAYLVGFNNTSFFYELYRKHYGTGKIRRK